MSAKKEDYRGREEMNVKKEGNSSLILVEKPTRVHPEISMMVVSVMAL